MDHENTLVTVFGGSGFIGTQLVQALARRGHRVRVAVRRPDLAGHVRMLGGVGQVVPVQANIRDAASVRQAIAGAGAVVNLVGIGFEKGRQRFAAVNARGAATVAEAAREAGVTRLVHMSGLGFEGVEGSGFARSKTAGEEAVLEAFPEAVIIRPSIVFGPGDGFFNLLGSLARMSPVLPLIGGQSRFQPVHVGDVAEAIAIAVGGGVPGGRIYELGGPDIETYRQLTERVLKATGRSNLLLPLPVPVARAMAMVFSVLPRPLLTGDQITLLQRDNVVSPEAIAEHRTLAAFGILPTSMDAILPDYLWRFRRNGQFDRQTS
ncbi:complex I NDUFA9 subunit family protein [Arsenicitalea aurantiaca]|uniref:Complex I NDUFA9 subunit family protein n=1 Tax=Arsenicitalea aurantiaca TaxID=1783274 RepID=A0A433X8H5_9HYPH|nr:complex I NDUFA9 subunit family protein [Arsenicitalea aurantiaca]RUT30350.1 complex I NDUFA9 subunit family protein [Arsenicitalea aurantiaca]